MPHPRDGTDRAQRAVLLIDEDPATARLLRLGLHGPRCQVVAASSPQEGLSIARRLQPDLVLLEMRFEAADGFQLAGKLQAGDSKPAFAFVTLAGSVVDHFRAIQMGAMAFLRKPVDGKRLGAAVDAIFARLERGDPGRPVSGPAAVRLLETLTELEKEETTGTLLLARPGERARIQFGIGKVQHARYGAMEADAAISAMARHGDWQLKFHDRDQVPVEAVALFGSSSDEATDLSSTAPQLPKAPRRTRDLDQTLTEAPRNGTPGSFAPESVLGTTQLEEGDDRTMVDPTHPLLFQGLSDDARVPLPNQPNRPTVGDQDIIPTVSDTPLDLTGTDEVFEEDMPTPLQFGLDDLSIPTAPGPQQAPALAQVHPPAHAAKSADSGLPRWLSEVNRAPLLLVIPNDQARLTLTRAAQQAGFSVLCSETGKEAYASAIQVRPVAILSDLKVPDMDGRELVAAIRTDFVVRETPVLMISGDELAARIETGGPAAVDPVLQGLKTTLMPRVQLYDRLKEHPAEEVGGPMLPIGIGTLLRTIGAARLPGRLSVRHGEARTGEVVFGRGGELCGATVNAPESTVGPLAMLHLVGYEWREFSFTRDVEMDEHPVPLGDLDQLVELAHRQNNILLARAYQEGVNLDDLDLDRDALDTYLQVLPPDSLEALIRLVEGEPAAMLATSGAVKPNVLRSMVFELRRRAVLRPRSLRLVRLDSLTGETRAPAAAPAAGPAPGPRQRWVVVVVAGFATALLAAGGYLAYWHFLSR